MDGEPSVDDGPTVAIAAPSIPHAAEVRRRTLVNAVVPLLIGAVLGAVWQLVVMPRVGDAQLPNPVHGALMLWLLCVPLSTTMLVGRRLAEAWEYALGLAIVAVPLASIWLGRGAGALFCGVYMLGIVWMAVSGAWATSSWPNNARALAPFRSGIWHTLGVGFGAFLGSVLAYVWS